MLLLEIGLFLLTLFSPNETVSNTKVYSGNAGIVHFISNAPLEKIEAKSNQLSGAVNVENREFYFSIRMVTFNGFNSGLQQEHFDENYIETDIFPHANFKGRIVEDLDLSKDGKYNVRAKGIFSLHGIEQERIIDVSVNVSGDKMKIQAYFNILLADHNITIPKIVEMKIAKEVAVDVHMDLSRNDL